MQSTAFDRQPASRLQLAAQLTGLPHTAADEQLHVRCLTCRRNGRRRAATSSRLLLLTLTVNLSDRFVQLFPELQQARVHGPFAVDDQLARIG